MTPNKTGLIVPKNTAERRHWVIFELRKKGLNLSKIARSLNVARQSVYSALSEPSARIEQAIADALDLPVEQLFFERFDGRGNRTHHTRPANISAGRGAADSQNDSITQTLTERAA